MDNFFNKALQIAIDAHKGQKDKCGADYVLHPKTVSSFCKTEKGKVAALLHDVVEDSDYTLLDLQNAGFDNDILKAVDCLTQRENEDYESNFKRIIKNDLAIEVKLCDLRHNSDVSRWPKDKYDIAIKNSKKYCERAKTLIKMIGEDKARELMTVETQDYFKF